MSSIHNTQRCLLETPGVTYERLLPICLTLFSCSSCQSVCMSAVVADRSLFFPPLHPDTPPHPPPTHLRPPASFQGVWEMAYPCGVAQVRKRPRPRDLQRWPRWPKHRSFSPPLTANKNKSYHAPPQLKEGKNQTLISMWGLDNHLSTWPVISPTGSAWHLQQRGDGAQVVHLSSRLPLSPLLSISLFTLPCVHSLISKQWVDSHYGNPGKWPRHFPPYLGSPSGEGTLAHTAPLVQSVCVCVLVSLCCRDGFHSPLATMRLAHQVDSIRIDNPFQ